MEQRARTRTRRSLPAHPVDARPDLAEVDVVAVAGLRAVALPPSSPHHHLVDREGLHGAPCSYDGFWLGALGGTSRLARVPARCEGPLVTERVWVIAVRGVTVWTARGWGRPLTVAMEASAWSS